MSLAWYLILAGVLFAIGATTVLVRRSAVITPPTPPSIWPRSWHSVRM